MLSTRCAHARGDAALTHSTGTWEFGSVGDYRPFGMAPDMVTHPLLTAFVLRAISRGRELMFQSRLRLGG